jgi:nucleoside-diphosphate-sugar epimerase
MNLYAATKQALEDLLAYYSDAFGISAVRLTLCDIYSEHDVRRKLMTDIANAWASNYSLTVLNNDAVLDLLHVEEVARAFLCAAHLLECRLDHPERIERYSGNLGTRHFCIGSHFGVRTNRSTEDQYSRPTDTPCLKEMRPWRGPPGPRLGATDQP